MRLYYIVVRSLYYLTWPITGLYLHNSQRVRVLVVRDGQILLVKSSYGTHRWSLPGGGVDRGESYMSAAVRELAEETGLDIQREQLQLLGTARVSNNIKFPAINNTYFYLDYKGKQEPKIVRKYEIQHLEWFKRSRLPSQYSKSVTVAFDLLKTTPIKTQ